MAPIRPYQSSLSFSQPPKGTWHKQHVCRHNESSKPEDGKATKKSSAKRKCKHDPVSSADESTDRPSTTKKTKKKQKKQTKKWTTTTDNADEGDESEDEAAPRDEAPADMDENEKALSTSFTSLWLHFSYLHDRESHCRLDIGSVWPLPLATIYKSWRWHC